MRIRSFAFGLLSILIGGGVVEGQTHVYTHYDDVSATQYGRSLAGIGDVDGDGYGDYVIGAPFDGNGGSTAGRAVVISGRTKVAIREHLGAPEEQFGTSVSESGDIDGDGRPDYVVGALYGAGSGVKAGSAHVYSGATGALLATFHGDALFDGLGSAVSDAGDVDLDGMPDLVIGAFRDDDGNPDAGSVRVYSGQSGALLYQFDGDNTVDELGSKVSGAGDVDMDGYADVMSGTTKVDGAAGINVGLVRVYSGRTGGVLHQILGTEQGEFVGSALSDLGDVNGDGGDDFIVGAYGYGFLTQRGRVQVISGIDGAVLFSAEGEDTSSKLGASVSAIGDVDGDGIPDVLAGAAASSFSEDYVDLYSGATGASLGRASAPVPTSDFARSVASIDDVQGDGVPDFIVGGPELGHVYLWVTACKQGSSYGTGCPGTGGLVPQLDALGCATPGSGVLLHLHDALPGAQALLFLGLAPADTPVGGGCAFLVAPPMISVAFTVQGTIAPGEAYFGGGVPLSTQPLDVFLQTFLIDAGGALGFSATKGLKLPIQ